MNNLYCEKHEWPAGTGEPCPDCAILATVRSEMKYFKARYENAVLGCDTIRDELKAALLQIGEARRLMKAMQVEHGYCYNNCLVTGKYRQDEQQVEHDETCKAIMAFIAGEVVTEKRKCDVPIYGGSDVCGIPLPCDIHDRDRS